MKPIDDPDAEVTLELRNLRVHEYDQIKAVMDNVYPDMGGAWPKNKYVSMLRTFAEGQICIEDKGRVVAPSRPRRHQPLGPPTAS